MTQQRRRRPAQPPLLRRRPGAEGVTRAALLLPASCYHLTTQFCVFIFAGKGRLEGVSAVTFLGRSGTLRAHDHGYRTSGAGRGRTLHPPARVCRCRWTPVGVHRAPVEPAIADRSGFIALQDEAYSVLHAL